MHNHDSEVTWDELDGIQRRLLTMALRWGEGQAPWPEGKAACDRLIRAIDGLKSAIDRGLAEGA